MPFDATTFEVDPTTLSTPRERLEYLRDFLLRLPDERLNMRQWYSRSGSALPHLGQEPASLVSGCGTAACICGWAHAIFQPPGVQLSFMNDLQDEAAEMLGLGFLAAERLFYPPGYPDVEDYTPTQAAAVLTHLLNTGEVDWSVARSDTRAPEGPSEGWVLRNV